MMLFLLTGEVQTGKTRWLESLVAELAARDVPVAGVLAPGQWVPSTGPHADENGYEKLGIDNVLLPSGERILFARRGDLAREDGSFDENSQAAQAELSWHIVDEAIVRVNVHFDALAERSADEPVGGSSEVECGTEQGEPGDCASASGGLLIVDELGRLEIWHAGGLTSAVGLLKQGPTPAFPHALVVVRDYLLQDTELLLSSAWPEIAHITPIRAARSLVIDTCMGD